MSRPTLLKVSNGVMINLNNAGTIVFERGMFLKKLKEGLPRDKEAYDPEDYVTYNADTVCFNNSLYFRVGYEITQEDFERIEQELEFLQFKLYERKPSTSENPVSAT